MLAAYRQAVVDQAMQVDDFLLVATRLKDAQSAVTVLSKINATQKRAMGSGQSGLVACGEASAPTTSMLKEWPDKLSQRTPELRE